MEYFTDAGFTCPMRYVAEATSLRTRTYLYRYNHAYSSPACPDLYFGSPFGVTHTAEISYVFGRPTYVFGKPNRPSSCHFTHDEGLFSRNLGALWVGLTRGGPSAYGIPGFHPPTFNTSSDLNSLFGIEPSGSGVTLGVEKAWRKDPCGALAGLFR